MTTRNGPTAPIPPLASGDRLSWPEFERRYKAHPTDQKFELIDGVVYMSSPVSHRFHSNPHFNLIGWLGQYQAFTPGVQGGDNATLRLDVDNAPQGDAFLIILPSHGGRVRIDDDGYVVGGPELVAEVAASSASLDANAKRRVYERNGVREYILWRVYDQAIDWFALRDGAYQPIPMTDGVYRSEVLPGLWLDPAALIAGQTLQVRQVGERGLASPEHAAFVTRLQQAAQGAEA